MLRVATDLFCQTRSHAPADILRYTELASALLETADTRTRAAIAQKLAAAPHAPEKLLRALLDDRDVTVASFILSGSPALQPGHLASFLDECGPAEAAAIARRPDIGSELVKRLAAHPHLLVVETLLENSAARLEEDTIGLLVSRTEAHPALADILLARRHVDPADLAPLYQRADCAMRTSIRNALEDRPAKAPQAVPLDAVSELNDAVHAADRDRIGSSLSKALRLNPAGMPRILDDPTAEVFALALAAAGIRRAAAIRVLLIAAPFEVRTSVDRIHSAAAVYDSTSRRVAREITVAVAGERRATGALEPHMHPSGVPSRSFGARRRPFSQLRPFRRTDIVSRG